jgi:DNA-binding beta-propeller fold protein YncE
MARRVALGTLALCLLAACAGLPWSQRDAKSAVPGYRVVRDVPLPGGTSRWDYQAYDGASQRLYIAHLGASQVVVFNTHRQRVVGVVDGIDSVHGMTLAPDLGRLFASATGSNRLVAVDTTTLHQIGTAQTGQYPDGVAYAASVRRLFVSNEHGTGDTVIDARTVRRVADVELGGDVGNSQFDPATGRVYVAVGSDSHLVALDPRSLAVVARHRLPGCQGAHGVQIDRPERHRAFVACEGNSQLLAMDLSSGTVEGRFDVGEGPDVLTLDPGAHRLYVAAESGQLAVFDVADRVRKLTQGNAGPNAHSVAVDSRTHVVYLPLTDVGGRPVLRELAAT